MKKCLVATMVVFQTTSVFLTTAVQAAYRDVVLADSPQAYYEFEESVDSTTISDSSGNGFDSIFVGTRTERDESLADFLPGENVTFGAAGLVGNSVRFTAPHQNGQSGVRGGYIETSLQLNLNASDTTIEFLIRDSEIAHGLNNDPGIIGQVFVPGRDFVFPDWIRVIDRDQNQNTDDDVVYSSGFGNTDGKGFSHSGSNPIDSEGEWQHVILTQDIDTKEQRWYVDGVLTRTVVAGTDVISGSIDYRDVETNWQFGTHSGYFPALYFDGELDEVSIYNYRLDDPNGDDDVSDSRTAAHFNALPSLSQTGDFNSDGDVDGNDFLVWQRTLGDASSLSDWETNFGTTSALSAATVPEPGSLLLAGIAAVATWTACRRHRLTGV